MTVYIKSKNKKNLICSKKKSEQWLPVKMGLTVWDTGRNILGMREMYHIWFGFMADIC